MSFLILALLLHTKFAFWFPPFSTWIRGKFVSACAEDRRRSAQLSAGVRVEQPRNSLEKVKFFRVMYCMYAHTYVRTQEQCTLWYNTSQQCTNWKQPYTQMYTHARTRTHTHMHTHTHTHTHIHAHTDYCTLHSHFGSPAKTHMRLISVRHTRCGGIIVRG